MNEDYLWDKSGEPDRQIKELEEILAPLRYQPKRLELPLVRRRNYWPLAIAATLLIALMAGGLWLRVRRQRVVEPQQAQSVPSVPFVPSVPSVVKEPTPTPKVVENTNLPNKHVRRRKPVFTKSEREEALAAKEQVMLALRLASEKLKSAQRRTQTPPPNQIKNQHRVG